MSRVLTFVISGLHRDFTQVATFCLLGLVKFLLLDSDQVGVEHPVLEAVEQCCDDVEQPVVNILIYLVEDEV